MVALTVSGLGKSPDGKLLPAGNTLMLGGVGGGGFG